MFAAWERGFDEFKKSEYYAKRAEAARQTAAETKSTDKGFIIRRIKEAEKTIRAQKKNLESYRKTLEQIGIPVRLVRTVTELVVQLFEILHCLFLMAEDFDNFLSVHHLLNKSVYISQVSLLFLEVFS